VSGETKKKPAKGAKGKNAKASPAKDKSGKGEAGVTIATHPRAGVHVRRAKGWGGLAGFGIAAALSAQAGVPPDVIGERAILAGVGGYVLAWGCSVTIWRQLVVAELRHVTEQAKARREQADAAQTQNTVPVSPQ
jgi:hypothetical protein